MTSQSKTRRRTRVAALVAAVATGTSLLALPASQVAFAADTPDLPVDTAHAESNLENHTKKPKKQDGVDRFIVALKEEAVPQAEVDPEAVLEDVLESAAEENGVNAEDVSTTATGDVVVSTDKKLSDREAREFMNDLAQGDNVEYIEPDVMLTIADETPARDGEEPDSSVPNDTYWDKLWGFHSDTGARVDHAWDYGVSGEGQVVAVVDSGILSHPDLDEHVLPGYDFISSSTYSRDGNGRDADPTDEGDWFNRGECGKTYAADSSWHGTHVAGTIAAIGNNDEGVIGVAPEAKILPVRAVGKCGGSLSDISDAVVWASGGHVPGVPDNPNPANVINMSLGGLGQCSVTYQKAINKAVQNGATVVVAAGNDNRNAGMFQPANCKNVITVAATGETGNKAYYSNYGTTVDLAAPGGDRDAGQTIMSTLNTGRTYPSTPSYGTMQGTSMATPLVSGVAALILDADDSLNHSEVERILKDTARELPGNCNGGCGAGLVNAERAVQMALGEDATSTPRTTPAKPTSAKPTSEKPTSAKPTSEKPTSAKPTTKEPTPVEPEPEQPGTEEPAPVEPTETAKPTQAPEPVPTETEEPAPTAEPVPTEDPAPTVAPEPTRPTSTPVTTTPAPTYRPTPTPTYRPPYYYNPYYPYNPPRTYRRYWNPYWYLYGYGGRYTYFPVRYVYSLFF